MAAGDTVATITEPDFLPPVSGLGAGGTDLAVLTNGVYRGASFAPLVTQSILAVKRLPATAVGATGYTFKLMLAGDPNNSPDTGKVVVMDVAIGLACSSGAFGAPDTSVLGTANSGTLTLATTVGYAKEVSIAVTAAAAGSAASNAWALIRIRRLGGNVSDTCKGRVMLLGAAVTDT